MEVANITSRIKHPIFLSLWSRHGFAAVSYVCSAADSGSALQPHGTPLRTLLRASKARAHQLHQDGCNRVPPPDRLSPSMACGTVARDPPSNPHLSSFS